LFDENGLTIDLGQEINTLLDVLEDVYGFATLQDVLDLTNGSTDVILLESNNESTDPVLFLDSVFADPVKSAALRSALNTLLSESQLIEQVGNNFENVLPFLIEDATTQTLLLTLLTDNNGALALDLAAEVDTLLDIVETTYKFTTLEGLLGATEGLDLRSSANLGYAFGSLTPAEFSALVASFKDLQLVGALNKDNTDSLLAFLGVENVYVPATFDGASEVEYLLNLVYGLSSYLHENMEPGLTPIEDVDFTGLLLSDALAGLLLVQEGTPNSQLIVPNLAFSIESALIEAGLAETIIVPEMLLASSPESAAWIAEYNVLVTLLLTVAELASNYYELSVWGLEDLLSNTEGELVDTLAFADSILQPNMTALKQVIGGIVANSQILVATADNTLNNLVEPILGTPVQIDVIQEILTLLDVVEIGYKFTTLEGMYAISQDLSLENLAAAGIAFGSLSVEDATTAVQRLTSLQLVQALDRSLMLEVLNNLGAANIVVPQDFEAAYELSVILNLLYATSHYLHETSTQVTEIRGIDFGPLLTSPSFENFMIAEEGNTYSKLLVANFKQLMLMVEDMPALRLYFDVPTSLEAQFAESASWTAEYNRLVKFLIAFAGALNENIEFSNVALTNLVKTSFRDLNLDIIDPFNNPVVFNQTFGVLDDSEIIRASALKLFELGQLIVETVYGYELELPENIIENGTLKNNALQALLRPLVSILVDVKDASGLNTVRDLFLQRTVDETLEFLGLLDAIDRDDVVLLGQSEILNGLLSKFLTNPNNQTLFSTTILELAANYAGIENELITNIPFNTELFTLNPSALDVNGNLNPNELVIMFDLANALTTPTGLFEFNTLDDIFADGLLDGIFESDILMSYASNAIQNEALQTYVIAVANIRQGVATLPTVFVELDAALLDANGYVLVSELEALADVMYVLGLMDIDTVRLMMNDLMASPTITTALGLIRGYEVTEEFDNQRLDVLLASNIVYTVIASYLDNENLDNVILPFLPEALVDLFGNVDLGVPSDLKEDGGFSNEYISREELKALLVAVSYIPVNPAELDDKVFNFITNLLGANVNSDTNEDDLDRFLASGYLREKLSRLFLSEAVLDLFGETPATFNLPADSFVVVDEQRRLTAEELRNLVEAFDVLGITTIDELDFTFAIFSALTPAERETVFASAYLNGVVDGLIQNQQSLAIPEEVLAVTGEVSQEEILALIEALEILEVNDITNIESAIVLLDVLDQEDALKLQALEELNSAIVDNILDSLIDTTAPVITIIGGDVVNVEFNNNYVDQGATAVDNRDGNVNLVVSGDTVDTSVLGTYTIIYTASDIEGNSASVSRTVNVLDTTAPVILLNGNQSITIELGSTYNDLGSTATDNFDGIVNVSSVSLVNTTSVGEYTVTYTSSDSNGNTSTAVRTVTVEDTVAPTFDQITDKSYVIGSTAIDFKTLILNVADNSGTDSLLKIVVSDNVNYSTLGTYSVTVRLEDESGNFTEDTFSVEITPEYGASSNPFPISSAEEFVQVFSSKDKTTYSEYNNTNSYVKLTANIDLTNYPNHRFVLNTNLDGNGFTISNYTYSYDQTAFNTVFANGEYTINDPSKVGLFGNAKSGSSLINTKFDNIDIIVDDNFGNNFQIGSIIGYAINSLIKDIEIKNASVYLDSGSFAYDNLSAGIGAFTSNDNSKYYLQNVSISDSVVENVTNASSFVTHTGILLGYLVGNLTNATSNNNTLKHADAASKYTGLGITAGYVYGDSSTLSNITSTNDAFYWDVNHSSYFNTLLWGYAPYSFPTVVNSSITNLSIYIAGTFNQTYTE
jgi:hypothetical protein